MEKLNELVELANLPYIVTDGASKADMLPVHPETILAIAEAFRALEQENILLKQGCENNPLVHEMFDWKERAEAAEAKLAELDTQEPVGHFMLARDEDDSWWYEASEQNDKAIPLFTRPAPAVSLAEMVPEEDEIERMYAIYCTSTIGSKNALRHIRREILRKIEEAK